MARIIELDIDVKKLNKNKLTVKSSGTYAKISLIETPGGKYGDWMVVEKQTKEERESNIKSTILGNGKNINWGESKKSDKPVSADDLPI